MTNSEIKILVVEDNPDDQEIIKLAFEKNDNISKNNLHFAKDGLEALEYLFGTDNGDLFLKHHPTLIILDLNMPKMNGIELLQEIREHASAKDIPVVILTTSTEKLDWIDTHSLGINCFINKSADFNEIVKAAGWILMEAVEQEKL